MVASVDCRLCSGFAVSIDHSLRFTNQLSRADRVMRPSAANSRSALERSESGYFESGLRISQTLHLVSDAYDGVKDLQTLLTGDSRKSI